MAKIDFFFKKLFAYAGGGFFSSYKQKTRKEGLFELVRIKFGK